MSTIKKNAIVNQKSGFILLGAAISKCAKKLKFMRTETLVLKPMQTPPVNSIIPAISGAPSFRFETFWEKVLQNEYGLPIQGSVGFHFWIQEDMRILEERFRNDESGLKSYLKQTMLTLHPKFGNGKTRENAARLLQMYRFMADPTQKFFFIKKGTRCLYLVEKTRSYYYEDSADWGRHRIDFKFIREARGDETIPQLGRGMSTWMSGGMKVLY